MPVLPFPKQEAFAQALAAGATQREAYRLAGYTPNNSGPCKLAHQENIIARVAEAKLHNERGGSPDLGLVIDEQMRLYDRAAKYDSLEGIRLAKGLLADVGRLKPHIKAKPAAAAPDDPMAPELTTEEWIAGNPAAD